MYYLGIDGGGTKTQFTVINKNHEVIYNLIKGTCHPKQVGYHGLESVLREGLLTILNDLAIKKSDFTACCLGLAGYGNVPSIVKKIDEKIVDVFNEIPYMVKNDIQIALHGALNGDDGIVIIAGTGSIGMSKVNNAYKRVGGFGYTIGDEGSAYWIGKKTLEFFSKQVDGRIPRDHIYTLLKDKLSIENDYDIINYVNETIKNDRSEIAKLAELGASAALLGAHSAIGIFNMAGKELASIANVLLDDFSDCEVKLSYIGGVFKSQDLILKPFYNALKKNVSLAYPKYEPSMGAALIAMDFINKLNCNI